MQATERLPDNGSIKSVLITSYSCLLMWEKLKNEDITFLLLHKLLVQFFKVHMLIVHGIWNDSGYGKVAITLLSQRE